MTGERPTPISVDPATGLKIFADARRAGRPPTRVSTGYSVVTDERLTTLPPQPPGARVQRRGAGEVPRVQGSAPRRGRLHGDGGRVRQVPRGRLLGAAGRRARRSPTSARSSWSAPASPGCCCGTSCSEAGFTDVRFCEKGGDVGGTWYWNRYPGHRLRRRVVQLPAAARGDGLRPDDEVRVGLRDPRVLPEDGREVRLLRPLPVPHHRRGDRVGRGDRPLDRVHRPRRRHAGPLRDPRQRHPHHARSWPASKAWRRSRATSFHTSRWNYNVDLDGQAGRHHRHRRHRRAGDPRAGQDRRASSTCSSARRRRSTCATSAPPRPEEIETWANEPGWARARRARFAKISAGPHGDPGQRRLPRRQGRRLQGAQAARARADARRS